MKHILYIYIFSSALLKSQTEEIVADSSALTNSDSLSIVSSDTSSQSLDIDISSNIATSNPDENIVLGPLTLDAGYKGFLWGSPFTSNISTSLNFINADSLSHEKLYRGMLGEDSVAIVYSFADSGFWKVEIDFILDQNNFESQIENFRRIEKNLSSIYGPPKNINQKESGVSSSYSNILNQKFSSATYRSSWDITPAIVELYLNSLVLNPITDLPVFSGDFSFLKLVYFNPDFMHSSTPLPDQKPLPSIFDIY